jgi:RNA polymerase sigma-70 factor (ECF subfamily)
MHTTPVSLLEQLRQPNASAAWERFVRLYTPLLFSWARRLGLQESDAADLVQEVFMQLVKTLPRFEYDPRKSFRAWLHTITLNKWRDRRPPPKVGPLPPSAQVTDVSAVVFEEAEYQRYLVRRALELMKKDFQDTSWNAFWEHCACGRPAKEVADELRISVGAVYAATYRVTDRLRQELKGLLD